MVEQKPPCRVCKGPNIVYEFRTSNQTLFRCVDCDLLFVPQLDRAPTGCSIVESWAQSNEVSGPIDTENRAETYLDKLKARGIKHGSRFWAAGKDVGYFIDCAQDAGFTSIDDSLDQIEDNSIDACVLLANLGKSSYPLEQLLLIREVLKPGAILLITDPRSTAMKRDGRKVDGISLWQND